jgi:glutaryl-CoA dehydrogenase
VTAGGEPGNDAGAERASRGISRRQFGEPLVSFQIIQQRLVSMLADLAAMQLYSLQIGRLAEAGRTGVGAFT